MIERTKIWCTSLPYLTPSYEHVIDFANIQSRNDFFTNLQNYYVYSNIQYDGELPYITVPLTINQASKFDYIFFNGSDRVYFYFVVGVDFNTKDTTNLLLELDVFNTYYYDCRLKSSFVDRMHVDRWRDNGLPALEIEDEGIPMAGYYLVEAQNLAEMEKAVIIASSVPLGYVPKATGNGGWGSSGGTSWKDGKISSQGFRFIKGYEGFGKYHYTDSSGIPTIGYGVASHSENQLYNEMVAKEPITEEYAAQIMYDLACKNYAKPILDTAIKMGVTKQCQFDALVSLAYNSGVNSINGLNSLTQTIYADINNESAIRSAWQSFKTNGGLAGLVARRKDEVEMFFGGSPTMRPIVTINSDGSYGSAVTENNGNGWLPNDTSYEDDDSTEGYEGHITVNNAFGNGWLVPVKGATVTSPYGNRIHPISGALTFHNGIDLACPKGTPILAPKAGTVTACAYHSSMGNYTKILHANNITTIYMHQSKQVVSVGDTVTRGQKIGEVGTTGSSTGNHLHWEFRNGDNETTPPMPNHNVKGKTC